jgi:elongation factor Ts
MNMTSSLDAIKQLRDLTSCGVIECKNALEKAGGNMDKAKEILQQRGMEMAAKKGSRVAKEGRIESYVHMGNKIAVLVEVNCETDFVGRNEDFVRFTKDVAMHIAAMSPKYVSEKDVPADVLSGASDKKAFLLEVCLLNQPFVREPSKTIGEYLNSIIAKIGENIVIGRFIRYKVGEVEA